MDIKKIPLPALKDLRSMVECAKIRAEVDGDIERYKKHSEKLKEINEEIRKREP